MKLEWYTDNEPDKVQWAKDIFMDAMSLHCLQILLTLMFINSQLQPYHTELASERNRTNLNEPELASAGSSQPHAQSTAVGILGLGSICH